MAIKKLLAALSGVAICLAWTNPGRAADLTLKVADNVKIEVLRSSISGVTKSSEEPASTEKA